MASAISRLQCTPASAVLAAGDLQSKIYSLSAQLAQTKHERDELASTLDAAGLAKNHHAAANAKPGWDGRTKRSSLTQHQSSSPTHESSPTAYGRSALQHQISHQPSQTVGQDHLRHAPSGLERSYASFTQQPQTMAQRSHSVAGSRLSGHPGGLQQPHLAAQKSTAASMSTHLRPVGSLYFGNEIAAGVMRSEPSHSRASFGGATRKPPLNQGLNRQKSHAPGHQHHAPMSHDRAGQPNRAASMRPGASQNSSPTMLQILQPSDRLSPPLPPTLGFQDGDTDQLVSLAYPAKQPALLASSFWMMDGSEICYPILEIHLTPTLQSSEFHVRPCSPVDKNLWPMKSHQHADVKPLLCFRRFMPLKSDVTCVGLAIRQSSCMLFPAEQAQSMV